jgi:four helix bundle protein
MPEQMVIFVRTYDLVSWLIPKSLSFPRAHRFVVTKRLQDAALDFQERIIEANRQRGRTRLDRLRRADAELDKVRLYLRLAQRWGWLTEGQYRHASEMVREIGAMLGGWIAQTSGTKRQP